MDEDVLAAKERLRMVVEEEVRRYHEQISKGGEPTYPQWAEDAWILIRTVERMQ